VTPASTDEELNPDDKVNVTPEGQVPTYHMATCPDLTAPDFFLSDFFKSYVYKTRPMTTQ